VSIGFRIETLSGRHKLSEFQCGTEPLDRYFREQVTQDIRRRATLCYVAVAETGKVAGYYTLAASGVPLSDLPDDLIKRLPRYPLVPVARMGRLAVDENFRGKQLGAALLWDAAMRAARSEMAVFTLVVDAKDAAAERFYRHHGMTAVGNSGRQLLFPLARLKC
jgi:ribosomal protein S18 acetylase RimI-like enzyme